jgi:predicted nucleotide-binding protein
VPRDNVVFELGLFIGALGRRRVFVVIPRGAEIKIPTDLLGLTPISYAPGDAVDLAARLGPVCTEIRDVVSQRGSR